MNIKRKKTGGRTKGTPNLLGMELRRTLLEEIEMFFIDGKFTENFKELTPAEKINTITKLMSIALPKIQAISIEQQEAKKLTIEDKLAALIKAKDT